VSIRRNEGAKDVTNAVQLTALPPSVMIPWILYAVNKLESIHNYSNNNPKKKTTVASALLTCQ
jgi:hypothetical protein